ncbi:MAG TPA: hypothetical protein VKT77_18950, partial [Chthonomonadaceae bacterium]|nr:hypothetical protein [Chthonomonadaceae bacterium]
MRTPRTAFLLALAFGVAMVAGSVAARADTPAATGTAAPAAVLAHAARFDFGEEWGETVDWATLDKVTRELAPDRLDWDALCQQATGKPMADFAEGLPAADAARFVDAIAARLKRDTADKGLTLSQNDWAIVGCAVLPMQQVKGAGQKYVTSLGDTA